jgi:preprotein translocase subunit SecA
LQFDAQKKIAKLHKKEIIPKFRHSLVEKKLDKWINSAITAKKKQLNKDYIIENGEIKIVDYQNTGVV